MESSTTPSALNYVLQELEPKRPVAHTITQERSRGASRSSYGESALDQIPKNKHVLKKIMAHGSVYIISIIDDKTPLPPQLDDPEEDEEQFKDDPIVLPPFSVEYGWNLTVGKGGYINYNCNVSDICKITIGDRTLIGPNVSFFGASHPLDPAIRNGVEGPELGKEIHVGDDVWIGGNVTLLPGITVGRGAVIGAGSVVTKVGVNAYIKML